MINIKFENNIFLIKGNIDLGYIGNYTNSEFLSSKQEDSNIKIDDTYEDILQCLNQDIPYKNDWNFIKKYTSNRDGESIAKVIEDFFNSQEKKAKENQHSLNGTFIARIVDNFSMTSYPFWEEEDNSFVDFDKLPKSDDLENDIYSSEDYLEMEDYFLDTFFIEEPNDGTVDKPDNIKDMFKMGLPMFNIDKFFSNINGNITLDGSSIIFECSDNFGGNILCCAYGQLEEDLSLWDWRNH